MSGGYPCCTRQLGKSTHFKERGLRHGCSLLRGLPGGGFYRETVGCLKETEGSLSLGHLGGKGMEISTPRLENLFVLMTAAAAFLKVEDCRTGKPAP